MGSLDGKVAFITGAARGQGRSHAVRLAEEGADVIGVDLCAQLDTVTYPMSTPEDLEETARLVEKAGRRMVTVVADVRDQDALRAAVQQGIGELGRLDIVLANAGVMFHGATPEQDDAAFRDAIEVMLIGAWNTLRATVPALIEQGEGGAIVLTGSTAAVRPAVAGTHGGNYGYAAAKAGLHGLLAMYVKVLAPHSIRINTVHPTGVDSPMLVGFHEWAAQQPEGQAKEGLGNLLPDVPVVQPADISEAIAYLVGPGGRYVTGVELPVDAGYLSR
jgi:SDR family mycofactocin-dependent oxidoreductase